MVRLLAARADPARLNHKGQTPLHLAAFQGRTSILDLVAQHCEQRETIDIQDAESGNTALHVAAYQGHSEVIESLIGLKADSHIENLDGLSPLGIALAQGFDEIAAFLEAELEAQEKGEELGESAALRVTGAFGAPMAVPTSGGFVHDLLLEADFALVGIEGRHKPPGLVEALFEVAAERAIKGEGLLEVLRAIRGMLLAKPELLTRTETPQVSEAMVQVLSRIKGSQDHEAVLEALQLCLSIVTPRGAQTLRVAQCKAAIETWLGCEEEALRVAAAQVSVGLEAPAVDELEEMLETELSGLVGLSLVKEQLRSMLHDLKINKRRKQAGYPVEADSRMHIALIGSPGTGKTKVARLLPKLLHSLGAINTASFVEANREDLVASYVGGTAKLTKERIQTARGGAMFIDEAYRLSEARSERDFGLEAIETIMVEMTKEEEDAVIFIFAGYPEQMERFLKSNPGMDRRVSHRFHFPDYSVDEMASIVERSVKTKGFRLGCSLLELSRAIREGSTPAQRKRLNGGIANLLVPVAVQKLNARLDDETDGEALITLQLEDFVAACGATHWPTE